METNERLGSEEEEEEEGGLSYGGFCSVCGYQCPNRRLRRSHLEHCGKALPAAAATTEAAAAEVVEEGIIGAGFGGVGKLEEGAREHDAAEGTLTPLGGEGGRQREETDASEINGRDATLLESPAGEKVIPVASISHPVPTGRVSEPQVSHYVHIHNLQKKLDMDSIEYLRDKELEAREHDRSWKRQWLRFLILAVQLLVFHGTMVFVDWAVLKLLEKEKILVLAETLSWFLFYVPIHFTKFWLDKKYSYEVTCGSECLNVTIHGFSYIAFHFLKESDILEDHFSKLVLAHIVTFSIEFVLTSIIIVLHGKADEAPIDV